MDYKGVKSIQCPVTFLKKNEIQQIFPSHHCASLVKIDFLQQTGYWHWLSTATTWALGEKREQKKEKKKKRTRKCLKFDELDFLHKSALFTLLPLTTGVRGVCESFLPLCALHEIYCLKRFLVRRYTQGTHTVYWQKKKKKSVCSLHNPNQLWCEKLYENFYNRMMRRLWCEHSHGDSEALWHHKHQTVATDGKREFVTARVETCLCHEHRRQATQSSHLPRPTGGAVAGRPLHNDPAVVTACGLSAVAHLGVYQHGQTALPRFKTTSCGEFLWAGSLALPDTLPLIRPVRWQTREAGQQQV